VEREGPQVAPSLDELARLQAGGRQLRQRCSGGSMHNASLHGRDGHSANRHLLHSQPLGGWVAA
jgi:hypothetical protein